MQDEVPESMSRLTTLADRLDCLTEPDFLLLADITPSTADAWRRRGEGPAFIRAGNRVLYPREKVSEWLDTRLRDRVQPAAKGML